MVALQPKTLLILVGVCFALGSAAAVFVVRRCERAREPRDPEPKAFELAPMMAGEESKEEEEDDSEWMEERDYFNPFGRPGASML